MSNHIETAYFRMFQNACFRIGLGLDSLILVLPFEIFLLTFVKMADPQGIKDSFVIFLSDSNFHLTKLSKSFIILLYFFSNLWSLVPRNQYL